MAFQDVKVNSPDYRNMDKDKAKEDFLKRIGHYEGQYESLDDEYDKELSFIKVFDAGKSFYVSNVIGKSIVFNVFIKVTNVYKNLQAMCKVELSIFL